MTVTVQAFGWIREQAGLAYGEQRSLDLGATATVAAAIEALGVPGEAVKHILLDGQPAAMGDRLHDGAELTLMPAFTGGT